MSRVTLAVCAVVVAVGAARAADPKPLWEIDAARPKLRAMEVKWLGFSPDGKLFTAGVRYLVTEKRDEIGVPLNTERLLVWDAATRKEKLNEESDAGFREALGVDRTAMTAEGTLVIGAAREVRLADGKAGAIPPGVPERPVGVWQNPKTRETVCLVGDETSEFRLVAGKWPAFDADAKKDKAEQWTPARIAQVPFRHVIHSAVASPDLKRIAIATEDNENGAGRSHTLRLFTITTGEQLEVKELASVKTPHRGSIVSSRFSPDGKTLALGSMDCSVSLWDVADAGKGWKPRETIPAGRFTVSCLAFSPDGRTLAAGTYDRQAANLFLIDVRGGKLVSSRTLGGSVTAVAYSPDGNLLATGDVDAKTEVCRVRVWDAAAVRGD